MCSYPKPSEKTEIQDDDQQKWGGAGKSFLSKWDFRIHSPCSQNLRPELSHYKAKLRRLFHRDRVYQSNTLFGCTSVYESSPLSLKMKKYGPHLVWIVHVFIIFTEVSLSFHLLGKKKGKKPISGHSERIVRDEGSVVSVRFGRYLYTLGSGSRARPCEPLAQPCSPSLWLHPNQLKPYDVPTGSHWSLIGKTFDIRRDAQDKTGSKR